MPLGCVEAYTKSHCVPHEPNPSLPLLPITLTPDPTPPFIFITLDLINYFCLGHCKL